jgi:moderate conductance mechanosensitive channel
MKPDCSWGRLAALACVLLALPMGAAAASKSGGAKKGVELPEPLTKDAIRELVSRLSDEEVRDLLLAQLDKAAAPAASQPAGTMAGGIAGEMDRSRAGFAAMLQAAPVVPAELGAAVGRYSEGRSSYQLLIVAALFAILLALGGVAEGLVARLLGDVRKRLESHAENSGVEVGGLIVRAVLDLFLLAVFIATVIAGFLALYQGHEPTRELIVAALLTTIQVRLAIMVARFLLAPRRPALRLLRFDDASAGALYGGVVVLAWVYGILDVLGFFLVRFEVPREPYLLVMTIGRVIFVLLLLRVVWRVRHPIAAAIRGEDPGTMRRVVADLWPALMSVYILGLLVVLTVEQVGGGLHTGRAGILSLLVVIAMPLANMALCGLLDRRKGQGQDASGAGSSAQTSFGPVLRKAVHILVTVAGVMVIVGLWDIDLMSMANKAAGASVAGIVVDVGVTLLLAYLVWQLAKTTIDRRIAQETGPKAVSDLGEAGGIGASRLRTLLPLARGSIFVAVCVMSSMTILAALGVNIGPLLAGAGVIGLAVGFGAQTLVRDIISGAFYLLDDSFRLGEYINVGDAKGTVEKIGIRSMQLRHHRGPLNIVPYGGIRRMTNESRDWVVEKLEFRLTYDTDIAKVKKIVKRIGQELMADPELSPNILQPLKSQGVMAMEDSALLVKAKFTAKPGEQFVIRREAYQRLKQAFDDAGIHFAHRQVTVFVPPGSAGGTIAAAGAAAIAAAAEAPKEEAAS